MSLKISIHSDCESPKKQNLPVYTVNGRPGRL